MGISVLRAVSFFCFLVTFLVAAVVGYPPHQLTLDVAKQAPRRPQSPVRRWLDDHFRFRHFA